MSAISFALNGGDVSVEASPEMPLLWVIRDILGLTGTKYGCGIGLCGACTVHVDGSATRSCLAQVGSVADREVTTIEGLLTDVSLALRVTWAELNVAQCGYCQAGQIMTAAALLEQESDPSPEQIAAEMREVLCRCGTYLRVAEAIRMAAASR